MDPELGSAYASSAAPSPRRASSRRGARTPRSGRSTPARSVRRPVQPKDELDIGEIDKARRPDHRPAEPVLRPPKHASPHLRRLAGSRKQAQSRGNRAPTALALSSRTPPPSPARVLLRKAQKVVEADAAMFGKRPTIMDVILNARAPVTAYSEDIVMEALERSEAAFPAMHDFDFDDSDGVEQYWAVQAMMWRGHDEDDSEPRPPDWNRYQESAERSTASWPSGAEEDASSQSDAQSSYAYGPPVSPGGLATCNRTPRHGVHEADMSPPALRPSDGCSYPDIVHVDCGS
ncbi:uncharacterized protein C8Q71DRAFT_859992 [Rhodofomes roseus]|uniref:Uncharacterized protein n=1 Tax=Rhodofomes roseus TaxID=34475 RepID=A0ABQ8K8U2_9APHY|nr:uncharacterized protein C8Q71DRAFT_859992 [Rhodofomes roseus]KAH9833715.1 hypothetical protein C8Q71DRAFT_859992 [Rhodofomes roseus]